MGRRYSFLGPGVSHRLTDMQSAASRVVSLVSGILIVGLLGLFGVVGTVWVAGTGLSIAASSGFVPADGHSERVEMVGGAASLENGILTVGETGSINPHMVDGDAIGRFWRMSMSSDDGFGAREVYFGVTSAGVTLEGVVDRVQSATFEPGLPLIPAQADPGATQQTTGTVRFGPDAGQRYRYELEVDEPSDPAVGEGCLRSRWSLEVEDEQMDRAGVVTWCPGRGLVNGGVPYSGYVQGPVAEEPLPPVTGDPVKIPSGEESMKLIPRAGDEHFGFRDVSLDARATGVTTDGVVVSTQSGDKGIVGLVEDALDGTLSPSWTASPPGKVVGLQVVGHHVVVSTSTGHLLAYDDTGRRLWQSEMADMPFGRPQPLGDDAVVVSSVTGHVTVFDLADGTERWRTRTDPLRSTIHVVDAPNGQLVVADTTEGEVMVIDATGQERWTSEAAGSLISAAATDTGLVVLNGNKTLVRYSYDDGAALALDVALARDDVFHLVTSPDHPGTVSAVGPDTMVVLDATTLSVVDRPRTEGRLHPLPGLGVLDVGDEAHVMRDPRGEIHQSWESHGSMGQPRLIGQSRADTHATAWWYTVDGARQAVIRVG